MNNISILNIFFRIFALLTIRERNRSPDFILTKMKARAIILENNDGANHRFDQMWGKRHFEPNGGTNAEIND
ncbi:MAG: hypothetical protein GXP03_09260 [Alphaproteobacteria bacterium]|nr:hypothetical protein [Alphaproteobacteria bacterium]